VIEPHVIELKDAAKQNTLFRKVLFTAARSQLVIMSLLPGEQIGSEVHEGDQLVYATKGHGIAVIGGREVPFDKGTILCIPAGAMHNVINREDEPLKLFTIYAPPQHTPGTIHGTKAEADAAQGHERSLA
jgi:mannose-6-phosphate isomerase-like protein (cupin superfamily)